MSELQKRKGTKRAFVTVGAHTERSRRITSGSKLDNGDETNDSPHRDVRMSTVFVPVDENHVELMHR
jgi:hypothetical protein